MKIEWLVADVTVVGSPDRAECASLEAILAGPIQAVFVVVEPLSCDVRTQSRALISLLRAVE